MEIRGKTVVVTGGAAGIGKALCERFAQEGTKHIIVVDRAIDQAEIVAQHIGGTAIKCDVSDENQIITLINAVEDQLTPIDLFCSNAGIAPLDTEVGNATSSTNADWERCWGINVMAHVYAARALLPRMTARGGGYFLHTISAAGLLSQIDGAVYSTTKHAAIGFAESLAITHRAQGIRVSALCPQGVDTPLLKAMPAGPQMGDWLGQVVDNWLLDAGDILNLSYSNRGAALIGESLTASGEITAIEGDEVSIDLHIKNEQGDVITPGTARVRLNR